uniref:Uncharacterized protein n=1 Tax=Moschus moschiferus TaxID=68415 RepID=A0A8C6DVH8_MOSMO
MSWLFPLTKSASSSAAGSPGGLTSLQQQKQRLIESLRNSHSSINDCYDLCFENFFCTICTKNVYLLLINSIIFKFHCCSSLIID